MKGLIKTECIAGRITGWAIASACCLSLVPQATLAQSTTAPGLDLAQPKDALRAMRRLACSEQDGKVVYYTWQGRAYSRVAGERDRHLFNLQGLSTRACKTLTSQQGSVGFRQVSREVMLYLDPQTNAILKDWTNPWTGETVKVLPVANDPVNSSPFWPETTGKTLQFRSIGRTGLLSLSFTIPLFYPNPLAGKYQEFVGGYYQAMELFDFFANQDELTAAVTAPGKNIPELRSTGLAWHRISPWLPWMKMGDRQGLMIFQGAGGRVEDWRDLPDPLRQQIITQFSLYQTSPPLEDTRPNQTTWTNFQEFLESPNAP